MLARRLNSQHLLCRRPPPAPLRSHGSDVAHAMMSRADEGHAMRGERRQRAERYYIWFTALLSMAPEDTYLYFIFPTTPARDDIHQRYADITPCRQPLWRTAPAILPLIRHYISPNMEATRW